MGRGLILMTALLLAQFLTACAANQHPDGKMASPGFTPAQFAKTDIDRIAEAHERELQASLKLLAEKLYKRNPKEWKKGGWTKADEPLDRLFGKPHNWHFPELDGKFGTDAVKLSLKPDYAGDRVFAFIAGLDDRLKIQTLAFPIDLSSDRRKCGCSLITHGMFAG